MTGDLSDLPHPPSWRADSYSCPHCAAFAEQKWADFVTSDAGLGQTPFRGARCNACKQWSLWQVNLHVNPLEGSLIWPTGILPLLPPSEDMPGPVAALYHEARSVASASPRSAAALLRLALEATLNERYPDADNLNAAIGSATADGLPQTVINAMDVLRFSGNAAIHEINNEDTIGTVTALSRILNLVIERLITEARQIAEMHADLPPGVLAQIERRDAATDP